MLQSNENICDSWGWREWCCSVLTREICANGRPIRPGNCNRKHKFKPKLGKFKSLTRSANFIKRNATIDSRLPPTKDFTTPSSISLCCHQTACGNVMLRRTKIFVKAGDNRNGAVAFQREKYVPMEGPSSGDRGREGNAHVEVSRAMNSLLPFRNKVHFRVGGVPVVKEACKMAQKGRTWW